MKRKLSNTKTKSRHLIYFLLLLFSIQSYADVTCGNIEGFEFTNGHESVHATDGETYVFDELPGHFYLNALIHFSRRERGLEFRKWKISGFSSPIPF